MELFERYRGVLASLPLRSRYEHAELLVPELLLTEDACLRVFYAPFDWENVHAKVLLLDFCPGWADFERSCRVARAGLTAAKTATEICRQAQLECEPVGSTRVALVEMLAEIGLPKALGLKSAAALLGGNQTLIHFANAIRYPVFRGDTHYTGGHPSATRSSMLMQLAREMLVPQLHRAAQAVIVPLGNWVEDLLEALSCEGLVSRDRWLSGFPHHAGGKAYRYRQLEENRSILSVQLRRALA